MFKSEGLKARGKSLWLRISPATRSCLLSAHLSYTRGNMLGVTSHVTGMPSWLLTRTLPLTETARTHTRVSRMHH